MMIHKDIVVLTALYNTTEPAGEYCANFAVLCDSTGFDRADVRRRVRRLARKGMAEYWRALWSDEGPRGAGYCITRAGIDWLAKHEALDAARTI